MNLSQIIKIAEKAIRDHSIGKPIHLYIDGIDPTPSKKKRKKFTIMKIIIRPPDKAKVMIKVEPKKKKKKKRHYDRSYEIIND